MIKIFEAIPIEEVNLIRALGNLDEFMNALKALTGYTWIVTSIISSYNFTQRNKNNGPNHITGRAIDITPCSEEMGDKFSIESLTAWHAEMNLDPLYLNRPMVLGIISAFKKADIPNMFVLIEKDHIHIDFNHGKMFGIQVSDPSDIYIVRKYMHCFSEASDLTSYGFKVKIS